jgi:hypothetical protein
MKDSDRRMTELTDNSIQQMNYLTAAMLPITQNTYLLSRYKV